MKFPSIEVILKNGDKVVLRSAVRHDAAQFSKSMHRWSTETEFMMRSPYESTMTLSDTENFLEMYERHPIRSIILAQKNDDIIGCISVYPRTEFSKGIHRGVFGIAIDKSQWHQGLGTMMTRRAVEIAKDLGFYQLELGVYSDNLRAIRLYEKANFSECGRIPRAVMKMDGTFMDEIIMVRKL